MVNGDVERDYESIYGIGWGLYGDWRDLLGWVWWVR